MIVIGNIFFKQKVGSSFKIVIILCLYIGYTVQQCILGNCLFTSLVISVLYNMADPDVTLLQSGNVEPMPDNSTRKRKRRVDNWKKTKDKKKRHSAQGFPNIPTCGHRERANGSKHCYDCSRLNMQDIRRFHQGFYKSCNKIDQDQFILRYAKGKELDSALLCTSNSAPGPDDEHYAMLRHLPSEGKGALLALYNRVFEEQTFPLAWRKSHVIPLYKPGQDKLSPSSYRPISLTQLPF
ncbi:uncharacterized protein LOC124373539 [Homalodisca vitripennis]|uniref:uncharacterized protein LOC124373539 n=1 Tax=Homalodisca vitripennis TaxID=197043 RepID=UPI001EEBAD2C|nr:uncharacterized protein LOC124373539 [Homalodisca vitripennis]